MKAPVHSPAVDKRTYVTKAGEARTYCYPHYKASERCKRSLKRLTDYLYPIPGGGSGGRWRPSNGGATFSAKTVQEVLDEGFAEIVGGFVRRKRTPSEQARLDATYKSAVIE